MNKKVTNQLKKLDENEQVKVTINMKRNGLEEICVHTGVWNNKPFTCDSLTIWRNAELFTWNMTVKDLIDLFTNKNITEIEYRDFFGLTLVESEDGNCQIDNIVWDETPSEQELTDLNEMDLYWNSETTEREYQFNADSIESIKIEAGKNVSIFL